MKQHSLIQELTGKNKGKSLNEIYATLFSQTGIDSIKWGPGEYRLQIKGIEARLTLPHQDQLNRIEPENPFDGTKEKDFLEERLDILPLIGIVGSAPEEIIEGQTNLIKARDFLQGRGYTLQVGRAYQYSIYPNFYRTDLNINSGVELAKFLGDLKELYELFEDKK